MKTATRERNRARTITALQNLAANYAVAPKMRQAAALRLSRLRAATTPAITTRAAKTTAPAPSEEAKFEAAQSFNALARQRTALFRNRRRTRGEQEAFNAMVFLMPATMPPDNDPTAWRNFVAVIDGLLSEIKNIKHP